MSEIRDAGQCVNGQRKFVKSKHPDRYQEWVQQGIELEELKAVYPMLYKDIVRLRKARSEQKA
jgi:hypothetical protein